MTTMDRIRPLLYLGGDVRKIVDAALRLCESSSDDATTDELGKRTDLASRWITAALLEKTFPEAADAAYARVVDADFREIPDVLLQRAKLAERLGQTERAASFLRQSLHPAPDFSFYLRAGGLAQKLRSSLSAVRSTRVALLSSSTTSIFRPVLDMMFLRDSIQANIYEGPFGAWRNEIADPESGLYHFQPDFVLLLLNWRDLGTEVERAADEISAMLTTLRRGCRARILLPLFTSPLHEGEGALTGLAPGGRARQIQGANSRILETVGSEVIPIDSQRLASEHAGSWEDSIQWSGAKLYPAPAAYPLLASHVAAAIRASLGLTSKALVLDLDNTLWGGIIGEDGLGGIRLGPPSAQGERFQELHRYLKTLKERGILLAVVSKNDPGDASQVFQSHESSVLKLEDFVAFRASWEPKPLVLRQLAKDLDLGLDSFVFLDDNPAERSAVRSELPEVIVPEISAEPLHSMEALDRGLYFETLQVTSEDRNRTASYRAAAQTKSLSSQTKTIEEFRAELQMRVAWGAVGSSTIARTAQLINKTNQFNLTTRRYNEEQVAAMASSEQYWFRWFRLQDRFADYGLIAVVLVERGATSWAVDSWLMSCRVIGRGVEEFMFRKLTEAARLAGASRITAHYLPTPKNELVKNLLPRLGFAPATSESSYVLDLESAVLPAISYLNETVS